MWSACLVVSILRDLYEEICSDLENFGVNIDNTVKADHILEMLGLG